MPGVIAVACLLSGRDKDLSAPTSIIHGPGLLAPLTYNLWMYLKIPCIG